MSAVDLTPIYTAVNQGLVTLFAGLITAGLAYLGYLWQKWFHAQMDTAMRNSLNSALSTGVSAGLHELDAFESVHNSVAVQGAVQRFAVQYAVNHAPDALAHFGLSPETLATKALAFIPPPPSVKTSPVLGQPSLAQFPDKTEEEITASLNKASLQSVKAG